MRDHQKDIFDIWEGETNTYIPNNFE